MSNFPAYGLIGVGIVFIVLIIGIFDPINSRNVIDFYDNDEHIAQRSGLNLISGEDISISNTDDPANNRVNMTIGSASESGIGKVATSTTAITIPHSLGSISNVLITPLHNPRSDFWISNTSTINFEITLSAPQTSTKNFYYKIYK
jgi:hypothetical protein